MIDYILRTPEEITIDLAKRMRKLRKRKGYSQTRLAERSNVSYGTIKKFEQTGKISLLSLVKIAMELDAVEQIDRVFTQVAYKDISEVIREQSNH